METEDGVLPHDAVVDLAGSIDGDVIKDDNEEECLRPCSASRMKSDVRVLAAEDLGLRVDSAYHLGRGHDRRASGRDPRDLAGRDSLRLCDPERVTSADKTVPRSRRHRDEEGATSHTGG